MRFLHFSSLAIVCAAGLSTASASTVNMISNPNFSTGNYSYPGYTSPAGANSGGQSVVVNGWTGAGNTGSNPQGGPFFDNGSIADGTATAGFIQGAGSLTDNDALTFTLGQQYSLSFVFNARNGSGPNFYGAYPTLSVMVDGQTVVLPTVVMPSNGAFYTDAVTFLGDGNSTPLTFSSGTGGADGTLLVSDVKLSPTPTPEPSGLVLLGTGALTAAGFARRKLVRA